MTEYDQELFVYGSGFTHDFTDKKVPLLKSDWGLSKILTDYKKSDQLLYKVLSQYEEEVSSFNIEALLTRLRTPIPFQNNDNENKIKKFYSEILDLYVNTIEKQTLNYWPKDLDMIESDSKQKVLFDLANYCKKKKIHCITLNIDTLFDEALLRNGNGWKPDTGYGFYCQSMHPDIKFDASPSSILYIKLHGSLNWKCYNRTYIDNTVQSIHHMEDWDSRLERKDMGSKKLFINNLIEKRPIVVPPLLSKIDFMEQPIFATIWRFTSEMIQNSDKITFIGYSFPETDYTVKSLFLENLSHNNIEYVTSSNDIEKKKQKLKKLFRTDVKIQDKGAFEWAKYRLMEA